MAGRRETEEPIRPSLILAAICLYLIVCVAIGAGLGHPAAF